MIFTHRYLAFFLLLNTVRLPNNEPYKQAIELIKHSSETVTYLQLSLRAACTLPAVVFIILKHTEDDW